MRMSVAELLAVGTVVGLNNFAVALMLGALGQRRRRWRIAGIFAGFEFTVPLIGLLLGSALANTLHDAGRLLGAALLVALGVMALRSATREVPGGGSERDRVARRVTSRGGLVALAAGLTLDNLVVGFSLGLGDVEPLVLAGAIAFFATAFTLIGLEIGARGRRNFEKTARIASGLLLVALGLAVGLGVF
jgi:putative Mn2+ efflux pump MntP